jgi:hypothetical protein
MPIELQIIRANEFLCVNPHGHLDFQASKDALAVLARACRKRGIDRAMLDLRALAIPAKPLFTSSELAALVATFREAGFARHQRLAILYRADPHGGARMFAFISIIRGWQVRAFGDFEEAFLWLSQEKRKSLERGEQEVPIHVTRRKIEVKQKSSRQTV